MPIATFQWLVSMIFLKAIKRFLMVYFYNTLVYLDTENHPKDQLTSQQWWDEKLYASRENYGFGV